MGADNANEQARSEWQAATSILEMCAAGAANASEQTHTLFCSSDSAQLEQLLFMCITPSVATGCQQQEACARARDRIADAVADKSQLCLLQAIGKALKEREAALLTLQAIEDERERKKKASAGLQEDGQRTFGGDKKKSAKAENLQNDVAALDAAAQAAQGEYDRITERNQEVWLPVLSSISTSLCTPSTQHADAYFA